MGWSLEENMKQLCSKEQPYNNSMKKAYIDRSNSELIVIGWDPYWSRKQMLALGLKSWAWIDSDDRAIPDSWEAIEVLDEGTTL